MAIKTNDIINILGLKKSTNSLLETIILEYGSIIRKIEHKDRQSWYFIRGEKSNLIKLETLKNQFKEIRTQVNSSSIDELIESLNYHKKQLDLIQNNVQSGFIKEISLNSFNSKMTYINELIAIKSRVDKMKRLDYYLQNKEALIKLLGW